MLTIRIARQNALSVIAMSLAFGVSGTDRITLWYETGASIFEMTSTNGRDRLLYRRCLDEIIKECSQGVWSEVERVIVL